MTQIKLMHAKLHRVTVTEANVNYVGSITIDNNLMDRVGILPLEEVDVINLANGKRWSTYAIAGEAGEGGICPVSTVEYREDSETAKRCILFLS